MHFNELYKKYYKNILKLIAHHYKGINNDDLMDINQLFWIKISKIEVVEDHFITLSYIIIKNLCIDWRRDHKKYGDYVELGEAVYKYEKYLASDSDLKIIEFNDKILRMRKFLNKRQAIILDQFLLGHDARKIHELTGLSEWIVRKEIKNVAENYQKI